jgi:hypothetical protein
MRAHPSLRPSSKSWVAACAVAFVLGGVGLGGAARAAPNPSDDAAFVAEWNAIASGTFNADATKRPPVQFLYMGFVQAAVYDAVVGIHPRYEPYLYRARAPRGASAAAAAVAAAHKIVVSYSPSAQATVDTAYAASLARIPDGRSKTDGIAYGTAVADNLIAARANDGRDAPILFTQPPGPGVWRPTAPQFAPMVTPWAGYVTPLMLRSGAQFGDPGPPPALTSALYTRDFNEVKELGALDSTARSAEQTATARFYSGNALAQFNYGLRDQVAVRHLDIVRAARLFAAVDMSAADTYISVWYAKLKYGFWRPDTAIHLADTDGNPATTADPAWTPMAPNPAYPEWVSGYSAQAGSFTRAIGLALHTRHLRVTLNSTAVTTEFRQYDSGAALRADVVGGRMWLGVHFRFSDEVGSRMGQQIAEWALDHYFEPVED